MIEIKKHISYFPGGKHIRRIRYYEKGRKTILHNEYGPADIQYYRNGNLRKEAWYIYGKLNNFFNASIIEYYSNGKVKARRWRSYGVPSCIPQKKNNSPKVTYTPSDIEYLDHDGTGEIHLEFTWLDPSLNPYNNEYDMPYPTIIRYNKFGKMSYVLFMVDNKKSNIFGPAEIEYDNDLKIKKQHFYINDKLFNDPIDWFVYVKETYCLFTDTHFWYEEIFLPNTPIDDDELLLTFKLIV